jgi:hypothetical protein
MNKVARVISDLISWSQRFYCTNYNLIFELSSWDQNHPWEANSRLTSEKTHRLRLGGEGSVPRSQHTTTDPHPYSSEFSRKSAALFKDPL